MRLSEVLQSTGVFDHRISLQELPDRRPVFIGRCAGRSVLHVGCCDVPVFDADTNLHLALAPHTDRLDGLDVSEAGIEVLRRHVDGQYFTSAAGVTRQYDRWERRRGARLARSDPRPISGYTPVAIGTQVVAGSPTEHGGATPRRGLAA